MLLPALTLLYALSAYRSAPLRSAPVLLRARSIAPKTVTRYGKFERELVINTRGANPFDPDQIAVDAVFTSPRGKTFTVPAYLDQAFTRSLNGNKETVTPNGAPVWRVRFTPDTVGRWTYRFHINGGGRRMDQPVETLSVTASDSPGFVRRSSRYTGLFAYDNGRPYFPIGENMCWFNDRGTYDYDTWLADLHKAGGDWIRLWMWENKCGIEWGKKQEPGANPLTRYVGYHGAGIYSLDNAWKVDQILDTAERNGVKVMICFGTYGEFNSGGYFNEGSWGRNPYNAANGGPCAKPADFWTDPAARSLYRKRLRYIIARYGWRTNVFGWEFWNEANAPADWIAEMARYIKGTGEFAGHPADPYGHLVSTTYGNDAIWKLPEIDFTMTHDYGTGNIPDYAPVIHADANRHASYHKPHLMAEYGIDWRKPDTDYDPEGRGVNLHNGLWSALASGDGGSAMIWWWDNYIAPLHLYGPFRGIRKFVDAMQIHGPAWQPLACGAPRSTSGPETLVDLSVPASGAWGKADAADYNVMPDGKASANRIPSYLYSPTKAELRTTPTFHVRYTQPGRFVLQVHEVSASAHLVISLDGQPAREIDFNASPPADKSARPEYARTEFEPQYGIYKATYDKEYSIDVSAGDHTITLAVTAGDWINLAGITLTNYRSSRYVDANVYGMTDGKMAILWAQNPAHNWQNVAAKKEIAPLRDLELKVSGLHPGRYAISWWNTETGMITAREERTATADGLTLRLPAIATDVAAQITPITNIIH
jgi:hypothetical protein